MRIKLALYTNVTHKTLFTKWVLLLLLNEMQICSWKNTAKITQRTCAWSLCVCQKLVNVCQNSSGVTLRQLFLPGKVHNTRYLLGVNIRAIWVKGLIWRVKNIIFTGKKSMSVILEDIKSIFQSWNNKKFSNLIARKLFDNVKNILAALTWPQQQQFPLRIPHHHSSISIQNAVISKRGGARRGTQKSRTVI